MPCSDLNGKEILKSGDTCICVADSLCCTLETNITLKQLYAFIYIFIYMYEKNTGKHVQVTQSLFALLLFF